MNLKTAIGTETVICNGKERTYNCYEYNSKYADRQSGEYLEDVIHVYEFDDSGLGNPDATESSQERDEVTTVYTAPTSIFQPIYIFRPERGEEKKDD